MQNVKVAAMFPVVQAGSKFFHGIFDQNRDVSILPVTGGVYDFSDGGNSTLSAEEYLRFFIENNGDFFDLSGDFWIEYTSPKRVDNIDREQFCETFFSLCEKYGECGRKEYFLFLHFAIYLHRWNEANLKNLKCLLFHLHMFPALVLRKEDPHRRRYSYNQFEKLFQDFSQTKLIFLLRNPLCDVESSMSRHHINYTQSLRIMSHWFCVYQFLKEKRSAFLIKLLDLHRHFDVVMKEVSTFLEITYDPSIQESTFWGNVFSCRSWKQEVQTNRANPDFIDWKGGILSEYEISVTRFFFRDVLATFFPENAKPLRFIDYLRVGKFCLHCVLSVFKVRSLREGYHDYFVPFRDFLRFYPRLKKLPSLDLSHVKTYNK
ncbi:MAG: hypothetical protein LBF76_00105 [Holosporales bacterium]|nr:hypothetical protein [Holosporales bacterium]